MSEYQCGHDYKPVFIFDNPLHLAEYVAWMESSGFEGDKSKCFKCYIKQNKKEVIGR